MREESSVAKGVFILSLAGIMTKLISLFYTPFLVGILGDPGYGVYSKTTEMFVFIYALTTMGAQPAVAKVVAEYTALENPKGAIRALKVASKFYFVIGLIFALLLIAFADVIANFSETPEMAIGLMVLAPCVLITSILAVLRGFMQGKNDMRPIAISQVFEQILNVTLSLLGAFILYQSSLSLALGNAGAQIGTSVGALFACIYTIYWYDKKRYKEEALESSSHSKKIRDKRILKKIIMYSIPITISAGLQNFGGIVDMFNVSNRLVVAGFSGVAGDALYGLYGKYRTLIGVPLVIITAISMTVLPALAKSLVLKDRKELKKKISQAFKLTFMIAIPSAVGLSMLSSEIYISLFPKNLNGADMMMMGSIVMVVMSVTQIQSVVLQGINRLYYILGTFSLGIVIKIAVNYFLVGIPEINIYGVLVGNFLWHLIPAILNHRKICSVMKMRMPIIRLTIKPIVASAVMAIVIYIMKLPFGFLYRFIEPSRLTAIPICIIGVAMGALVYAYLMILMRGITKKDIEDISPKIMKVLPRFMRMNLK
jgi:stage V sporulation protein B